MAGAQGRRGNFSSLTGSEIERLKELVRQLERNPPGGGRNEVSRGPDGPRGGGDGFPRGPGGPGGRRDTRRSPRGPDFRPFPARLDDLDRKMDRILQELEEIRREIRRR
jgi:hypothetical protein